MKSFNWLHLTDLHYGLKGQGSLWPNVREVFWNDLRNLHEKSGPWHAVLFTGDLVQSGSNDEFSELEDKVLGPLWNLLGELGSKDAVLLAVPGNHDLLRPDSEKPKAGLRQLLRSKGFNEIADEFWSDPQSEYREIISSAFANYQSWSEKNARSAGLRIEPGILPGDFCASLLVDTGDVAPLKIGVAGVNTTFLQLTKGDFTKRLVLDPRQIHGASGNDLPNWVQSHDACILMTHQGPDWFEETFATEAYAEINPAGRFAVHLFGHMHENILRSNSTGGGKIVRQWQGNSLFGLERFGDPPQTERRHGYGAGRIDFSTGTPTVRHWPRLATKDAVNGWRFHPDHNSCVLIEGESCTKPELLETVAGNCGVGWEVIAETAAKTESKAVKVKNHMRHLQEMELKLSHALESFKGQPTVFLEPKLSKTREFNEESNKLHPLMEKPSDTLIIAPPEFGLTCLGLYLQTEAFRKGDFWLYIDADQTKGRKIADLVDEELLPYDSRLADLNCVILDNWNAEDFDHLTMVKSLTSKCPDRPMVILAEDSVAPDVTGRLSKLGREFDLLHLQALSRNSMRKLVSGYNEIKSIGTEDVIVSSLAGHLESINIHRTPLNCYTLLRVLDSSYNEKLLNKSRLLKAILFVLFADHHSFSFFSAKPEVDECSYVLGCFCKDLVKARTRYFDSAILSSTLRDICKTKGIVLDVDAMLNVLHENNILVGGGAQTAFRHRHWICYFAAEWMRHDDEFRQFVLMDRNYVSYTEIIDFYTGTDGNRTDALETILADLTSMTEQVGEKIGIARPFDPLSSLLWNPSDEYLQQARSQIAERVESSNLPADIKDKHADGVYRSAAPYDQSISSFLEDFSVLSLMRSIKAASCALRSSPFVKLELRNKVTSAIFSAWEEISRVAFWLSPILAKDGRAIHEGFAIKLEEGFSDDLDKRCDEIITSNPSNIVRILGGDLVSKKICPLVNECFRSTSSLLQKHMTALFLMSARPAGWEDVILNYINLLHPRTFFLGNVFAKLADEVTHGDLEQGEELALKRLTRAIISKREYAPRVSGSKEIPRGRILSLENKLPIDQLVKGNRKIWPPA